MSRRIDYYFSLLSPWAYIGNRLFVAMARRHGAEIVYKPVQANEVFAETGGLPLAKRHPARQGYRRVDLQRWRRKRGLAFHLWPKYWPFDGDLANRTAAAIVMAGADPADFVQRAFEGVWEGEENLAEEAKLAAMLREGGHDCEAIAALARSDAVHAVYERNRAEAIAAGVFGSPAYVLDGEVFWGQDRLDLLDDALASARPAFTAKSEEAARNHT